MVFSSVEPLRGLQRGRWTRWATIGATLVVIGFAMSLVMSPRANADDTCNSAQDCFTAEKWERALANDYQNKGNFFHGWSVNYFGQAYEWNQKATFAFHAGDATAATWYKAIADDYSKKAVDNAKAADANFAQAARWRAAADTSHQRGLFLFAATFRNIAEYSGEPDETVAPGSCDPSDDFCIASADPKRCKGYGPKGPLKTTWKAEVGDVVVYRGTVKTKWCWRGDVVVSRKTDASDHEITTAGYAMAVGPDLGVDQKQSYCVSPKLWCFTQYQFGFLKVPLKYGGCAETTIYADLQPNHHRHVYGGNCKS